MRRLRRPVPASYCIRSDGTGGVPTQVDGAVGLFSGSHAGAKQLPVGFPKGTVQP